MIQCRLAGPYLQSDDVDLIAVRHPLPHVTDAGQVALAQVEGGGEDGHLLVLGRQPGQVDAVRVHVIADVVPDTSPPASQPHQPAFGLADSQQKAMRVLVAESTMAE